MKLETFYKNSADKIQSKKDKGDKMLSLMPIRVKHQHLSTTLFLMLLHAKENFLNFDSSTFQWSKLKSVVSGAFVATSQAVQLIRTDF